MWTFLIITFFILFIVAIIVANFRNTTPMIYDDYDDEVETHTTVTTTTTTHHDPAPAQTFAGTITRGWEDNKPYVFDPVDNSKMFLNESDDLYEDADGKVWNLI